MEAFFHLFAAQAKEYQQLQAQIDEVDVKLKAWHHADECGRRLTQIPGVGPIGAVMKTPAPEMFRSGRQFAAWIGLTPKDHSTGGKVSSGVIARAGDEALRSVLVVGSDSAPQVCSKRQKQKCALALARAASEAKASETGRRGAGLTCPPRLEADGHRPKLRPEIHTHHRGGSGLKISQPRGAHQMQPC